MDWLDALSPWQKTGVAGVAAILLHLIISRFLLRGLKRVATSTENDIDDRLVHFLQRFYMFVLLFALFLVNLQIHGIAITPLLACAGIAIGRAARESRNCLSVRPVKRIRSGLEQADPAHPWMSGMNSTVQCRTL